MYTHTHTRKPQRIRFECNCIFFLGSKAPRARPSRRAMWVHEWMSVFTWLICHMQQLLRVCGCVCVCLCLPSRMQIVQSVCKQLFQKFMNILCAACLSLCVCAYMWMCVGGYICVYLCVCASSIQLANVQVSHCLCYLHISYCCETWYFCILSHAARITND